MGVPVCLGTARRTWHADEPALPLLMITVVVYFTGELWQLAARMTSQRLWQTIGFLAVVAMVFMIATIGTRSARCGKIAPNRPTPPGLLAGIPWRRRTVTPRCARRCRWPNRPMSWRSWCVADHPSGVVHRGTVRVLPRARHHRGARRRRRVVVVGGNLPGRRTTLSGNLVRHPYTGAFRPSCTYLCLVAVLSGLYFTVSTSINPLYRERFFNPLIDDVVAVSLAGRDAYLEMENGRT